MFKIKKLTLLTHQSILAINCDVIKDLGYATEHKHTHKNHIYHSQNKLSNQGPSQLCPSHRNAEKKENILIKSCFLTAAGRGPSYLVMLSICFYSMRTCDVSELVSLFPLQHVPWCQEKSMCACWPRKKKNPRPSWRRGETQRLQVKGNICIVLRVLIYYKATQCN